MKTKEKKESSFMTKLFTGISLVYLVLGGALCAIPSLKMEYICYGISVTLIVLGIILIVKYFVTESYKNLNQYGFSIGVFLIIIGVCTLVRNQEMTKSFQLYIGICILLTAIIKLQNAMDLKALKDRVWGVICVVSVCIMAAAVLIIINPFSNKNYELTLTYFSLLFDGVISLFSYNYLAFRLRRTQKKQRKAAETAIADTETVDTESVEQEVPETDISSEVATEQTETEQNSEEQDSCTM